MLFRFVWLCRQDTTRFAVTPKIFTIAGSRMIYAAFRSAYWPSIPPESTTPSGAKM